ncbi:hypothetical protein [Photorhabdus antumapuensis]|uniref:hypothetical protein n=1 Tax=Photorhabdus antumapuensis TaxID=2862867 RepID=UPI001CECECA2|nr:hypothetical protein [Photorhabdus antumapuensis]MCA6219679.1 hypothetical protein [Photorhabdus antumapuensis]
MSDKFIWSSYEDQLYEHKYGRQTITPSDSLDKTFNKDIGFTFNMDAGKKDELKLDAGEINSIHWPQPLIKLNEEYKAVHKAENTDKILGETINISSGNLIILGSKEKPVNFYLNSEIFNKYRIQLQNSSSFSIKNSSIVSISGPINTAIPTLEESTVAMSGNSQLTIETVETVETVENIENFISLNCDFSITESSQAMLKSHHVHIDGGSITLQDNAQMFITAPRLDITIPKDEKQPHLPLPSLTFTLKAGATSLNLNSPDGCNFPLDIDRKPLLDIDFPKGVFNFMAEGEKNTGKVVIDVLPEYANAYGLNTMLRKNFIAINRKVVETGDQMKYFDFNYGQEIRNSNKQVGTITISLRNPNLQLPSK